MSSGPSLDHLIRSRQQRGRDRQAKRLGGFEIHDQLESGRLFDWQIGRFGALEKLSARMPIGRKAALRLAP